MSRFTVTLELPHAMEHVWERLVDWESHSQWIPGTTVTMTNEVVGVGASFVGRTRVGMWVLDDPMTVTTFEPPENGVARCTVTKTGDTLKGTAGFTLTATGPTTTRLEWFEDVAPRAAIVGYWLRPFIPIVGRIAFTSALKAFADTL